MKCNTATRGCCVYFELCCHGNIGMLFNTVSPQCLGSFLAKNLLLSTSLRPNWLNGGTESRQWPSPATKIGIREVSFITWWSLIKMTSDGQKKALPPPLKPTKKCFAPPEANKKTSRPPHGHGESTSNFIIYHTIKWLDMCCLPH